MSFPLHRARSGPSFARDRSHVMTPGQPGPGAPTRAGSERIVKEPISPFVVAQHYSLRRGESKNSFIRSNSPPAKPYVGLGGPPHNERERHAPPVPVTKMKTKFRVLNTISKASRRPLVIASGDASAQGKRPSMEDVHSVHLSIPWTLSGGQPSNLAVSYAAVYDGHCGKHVADLASQLLPSCILSQKTFPQDPATSLAQAFVSTDRAIYKKIKGRDGGSTCIAALLVGNEMYISNLGDARAVLVESGGRGQALSIDHKPTFASERARIEAAGGRVELGRVGGCLAVSRAFGDFEFKGGSQVLSERHEPVVSNVPEVTRVTLTDSCEAVILACDGVWDVVTSEAAAESVYRTLSMEGSDKTRAAKRAAEGLVQLALNCRTMDNVTVVVLVLHRELS